MHMKLTAKQEHVLKEFQKTDPRILILSGAKRSGKTFLNNILMLSHIASFEGRGLNFLIVGATEGSVMRNVLNDWENMLGVEFKKRKDGHINIFRNKVFVFGGEKSDSWKKVRGMTSHGTYINEATALNKNFINEVMSRTSGEGARIFIDTNPDSPAHFFKKSFIDKAGSKLNSGRVNIQHFKFMLDDNDNLTQDYIESIKNTTPSGADYERDILGNWTAHAGLVYKDFTEDLYIQEKDIPDDLAYVIGIDWGFRHYGACVVVGVDREDNYYVVDVLAEKEKLVEDFWLEEIRKRYVQYKARICYVDSAVPANLQILLNDGIYAANADKNVAKGIESIQILMKTKRVFFSEKLKGTRLEEELYSYSWGTDEHVVKEYDDVLDALRYAIFNHQKSKTGKSYVL